MPWFPDGEHIWTDEQKHIRITWEYTRAITVREFEGILETVIKAAQWVAFSGLISFVGHRTNSKTVKVIGFCVGLTTALILALKLVNALGRRVLVDDESPSLKRKAALYVTIGLSAAMMLLIVNLVASTEKAIEAYYVSTQQVSKPVDPQ